MTARTPTPECTLVHGAVFAWHRGELSPAFAAAVAEHLDTCDACARLASRLGTVLDDARQLDGAALLSSSPDALFARIAASTSPAYGLRMDDVRAAVAPTIADPDALFARIVAQAGVQDDGAMQPAAAEATAAAIEVEHDDENVVALFPVRRWMPAAFALAAIALAALAFGLRSDRNTTAIDAAPAQVAAAPTPSAPTPAAPAPVADDAPQPVRASAADVLATVAAGGDDAVRVLAADGAEWSVSGTAHRELTLTAGTVLVEFVPLDGATLRVIAPEYTIDVVGTVFYASTELDTPVGVLTGGVDVNDATGVVRVTTGQGWDGATVAALDGDAMQAMQAHVDPTAHAGRLADAHGTSAGSGVVASLDARAEQRAPERAERAPDASAEAVPAQEPAARGVDEPVPADAPQDPEALLVEGRIAAREGRNDDAVVAMESALERLSGSDLRASALRLDLARIYAHDLGRPHDAATHLRAFLDTWPDDVAAGSALRELCRIDDQLGQTDVRCEGGAR